MQSGSVAAADINSGVDLLTRVIEGGLSAVPSLYWLLIERPAPRSRPIDQPSNFERGPVRTRGPTPAVRQFQRGGGARAPFATLEGLGGSRRLACLLGRGLAALPSSRLLRAGLALGSGLGGTVGGGELLALVGLAPGLAVGALFPCREDHRRSAAAAPRLATR